MHTNLHLFGQRTPKQRLPVSDKTPHKNKVDEHAESMQTYLNLLDIITGELERRFGAIHSDIAVAVNATHPD